eukprot:TRINITY_DN5586_c0_g1_i1.p1 TRINITY_DN5586_c0_g1~~TRINITY_DN5586_c0_g1_i1.p1  ORF type:complete len:317 (-),score=66.77 TRINITY_DN5586_c0_g1_i1:7-957(-)
MGNSMKKSKGTEGGTFNLLPRDVFLIIYHLLSRQDKANIWNTCQFLRKWLHDQTREVHTVLALSDSIVGSGSVNLKLKIIGTSEEMFASSNGNYFTEFASKYAYGKDWKCPSIPMSIMCSVDKTEKVGWGKGNAIIYFEVDCDHLGHDSQLKNFRFFGSEVFMFHYDGDKYEKELPDIREQLMKLRDERHCNIKKSTDHYIDKSKKRYGKYKYSDGPPDIHYSGSTSRLIPKFELTPIKLVQLNRGKELKKEKDAKEEGKKLANELSIMFEEINADSLEEVDKSFNHLAEECLSRPLGTTSFTRKQSELGKKPTSV